MEKADGLSRRPDWKVGVEKDNKNQKLIKRAKEKVVKVIQEIKKIGWKIRSWEQKLFGYIIMYW